MEHQWVREATIAYPELMYLRAPVAREKGNERSRGKGPRQGEIRRHSGSEICHFIFGILVSHDRVAFGAAPVAPELPGTRSRGAEQLWLVQRETGNFKAWVMKN